MCNKQATVCKLKYESMLNLIATNALSASRLYKRIMRHYCYMQIYERKRDNMGIFTFKNITDEDLFIDFKLDIQSLSGKSGKDLPLFDLLH